MTTPEQKIVQYLNEAHATEIGLVRVLQEQIAMTPRGRYRSALEEHLRETRSHAARVAARRRELQGGGDPIGALVAAAQDAVGQVLALAKTPLDLVRGTGGEEKVLKNAKDACASEALEIATYIALEHLARAVDDRATAELAQSIRADEEAMLERIQAELPALAQAVARAEFDGSPSYDVGETGAAEAVREAAQQTEQTVRETAGSARRASRQARRAPGVAQAEGAVKGAVASSDDLPIAGYDARTADEIVKRLPGLSQVDIAKIEAYERRTQSRSTVLERIDALRGDEPWPGYDELTAGKVVERLRAGDQETATRVRDYERAHKARSSVLRAAERELASA